MYRFLVLFFVVFFSLHLSAQSLKKGFAQLEQGNAADALIIARKYIKDKELSLPAYYLLLKSQYAIGLANKTKHVFLYMQNVDKLWRTASVSQRLKFANDFNLDSLNYSEIKYSVLKLLEDSILRYKQPDLVIDFLLFTSDTLKYAQIIAIRDSLAFNFALEENSFQAYEKYINDFPSSRYTPKAKKMVDSAWMVIYEPFRREGDLNALEAFDKYYLHFPFKELLNTDLENAMLADQLRLVKPYDSLKHHLYVNYLKKAKTDLNLIVLQKIMANAIDERNYKNALDSFEKYVEFVNFLPKASNLKSILLQNPTPVEIKKWDGNVNTDASEYSPLLSANGKTLYFCAMRRKENIGGEDIFKTTLVNAKWSPVELLYGVSTIYENEAPESITADENTIVLFAGKEGGNLVYVEKTPFAWTQPRNFELINSPYFEGEASLSADGRVMFFVSDRTTNVGLYHKRNLAFHGGRWGNTDIYVAIKSVDEQWSKVIRLDSIINTPYAEVSPFLHPDMRTLYFCSNGHGGIGGLDVYKTTRLFDTSWVYWSEPVNLGRNINTATDNWGYKVSTDGTFAYYATAAPVNFDIFTVTLPENLKPEPIVTITGKLKTPEGKPFKGQIYWTMDDLLGFGQFSTDEDGNFTIIIPKNKKYRFYLEYKDVYIPPVDLIPDEDISLLKLDFELIPLDSLGNTEKVFELKRIYFDYNKSTLKKESFEELKRFAAFLLINDKVKVEIIGHTDAEGSAEYNLELSKNRALAVVNYLEEKGILPDRLLIKGKGETEILNQKKGAAGKNRRVEFRIISN